LLQRGQRHRALLLALLLGPQLPTAMAEAGEGLLRRIGLAGPRRTVLASLMGRSLLGRTLVVMALAVALVGVLQAPERGWGDALAMLAMVWVAWALIGRLFMNFLLWPRDLRLLPRALVRRWPARWRQAWPRWRGACGVLLLLAVAAGFTLSLPQADGLFVLSFCLMPLALSWAWPAPRAAGEVAAALITWAGLALYDLWPPAIVLVPAWVLGGMQLQRAGRWAWQPARSGPVLMTPRRLAEALWLFTLGLPWLLARLAEDGHARLVVAALLLAGTPWLAGRAPGGWAPLLLLAALSALVGLRWLGYRAAGRWLNTTPD